MKTKRMVQMFTALMTMLLCVSCAWAASADGTTSWAEAKQIYDTIKVIAIPLGAVGVAICAFQMLFGGEDAARKGKKTIIIICSALAAILLLPLAVKTGANIGASHKWDPKKPAACYIEEFNREEDMPHLITRGRGEKEAKS